MKKVAWYCEFYKEPWTKNHWTVDGRKTLCGKEVPPNTDDCNGLQVNCKICKQLKKEQKNEQNI